MTTIHRIPTMTYDSFEAGHYQAPRLLAIRFEGTGPYRLYNVGGWTKDVKARVLTGGPLVQGPQAYANPVPCVLHNGADRRTPEERAKDAELFFDVKAGDLLDLAGTVYTYTVERGEHVYLKAVAGPVVEINPAVATWPK